MILQMKTSVPQTLEFGNTHAIQVFVPERSEDTWQQVFDQVVAAGYDLENITVTGVHPDDYALMVSISRNTSGYPMVVMYDVLNRIYLTMFERYDQQLAIEFVRHVLAETAHIEELATISIGVREGRSGITLQVSYNREDNLDQRDLVLMVSEVTSGFDVRVQMISFQTDDRRVSFSITGPDQVRAVEAVRTALKRGYRNMIAEAAAEASVAETAGPLTRLLRRITSGVEESANVYADAAVNVGDRVIINDGTAIRPRYLLGEVIALLRVRNRRGQLMPRIQVKLDNGDIAVEKIDNTPTGMLGFAGVKRRRLDAISREHVPMYLDRQRWMSDSARALLEQHVGK